MRQTVRTNPFSGWFRESEEIWESMVRIEADLLSDGLKPFPINQAGLDAYYLWRLMRRRLLRGTCLEVTSAELKLNWHRQRLKRARDTLVEMQLIRRGVDGRYRLGRYSAIDEIVREQMLDFYVLEEVVLVLGTLMPKSKTRE